MTLDFEALNRLAADFAAVAAEHDRSGEFPVGHVARLHRAGLIGLVAPIDLGGQAADLPTALRALQTIAAADPATALVRADCVWWTSHRTIDVPPFR